MTAEIRVVLVEDHPMFRAGVAATLDLADDVTVVAAAGTAAQGWLDICHHRPDVAIIDLNLPDASGITLVQQGKAHLPDCHLLVLTSYDDDSTVYAALRAGAQGYLIKNAQAEDILRAVRTVATGAGHYSPCVVERITRHVASGGRASDSTCFPQLTRREREVLSLMAEGHSNTYIADHFVLSLKTVRNLVSAVMSKLGAASRAELVARARDAGLPHPQ
ncbi:MAG: response regulator transcription factor [Actinomycetota bacterium]|nr:response regulator transcription factor [Actinomycetota bacterium]